MQPLQHSDIHIHGWVVVLAPPQLTTSGRQCSVAGKLPAPAPWPAVPPLRIVCTSLEGTTSPRKDSSAATMACMFWTRLAACGAPCPPEGICPHHEQAHACAHEAARSTCLGVPKDRKSSSRISTSLTLVCGSEKHTHTHIFHTLAHARSHTSSNTHAHRYIYICTLTHSLTHTCVMRRDFQSKTCQTPTHLHTNTHTLACQAAACVL